MTDQPPSQTAEIIYCYDGSPACRAAIQRAHAALGDRPAVVVTGWPTIWATPEDASFSVAAADVIDRTLAAEREHALQLAREGAELVPGAEAAALRSDSSIWRSVLEYADARDAAIIVCGSRGRSDLTSLVLGSVSHGLVGHSRRPVMVVRA